LQRSSNSGVVLNASSLATFVMTESLDLLRRCYPRVYVPKAVSDEFSVAFQMPRGLITRTLRNTQQAEAESIGLGAGENEAMVLARDMQLPLIMDDGDAQKVAERLGVEVYGSLEFVRAAFCSCFIEREEYDERIDSFQESGRAHPEYVSWARNASK